MVAGAEKVAAAAGLSSPVMGSYATSAVTAAGRTGFKTEGRGENHGGKQGNLAEEADKPPIEKGQPMEFLSAAVGIALSPMGFLQLAQKAIRKVPFGTAPHLLAKPTIGVGKGFFGAAGEGGHPVGNAPLSATPEDHPRGKMVEGLDGKPLGVRSPSGKLKLKEESGDPLFGSGSATVEDEAGDESMEGGTHKEKLAALGSGHPKLGAAGMAGKGLFGGEIVHSPHQMVTDPGKIGGPASPDQHHRVFP